MNSRLVNFDHHWPEGKLARFPAIVSLVFTVLFSSSISYGYTVLTHEAIIDSVWDASLQKLLLKRFPNATPEELEQAHAYAYGGCIIQDMGYYPFGSRFFSDLTHYVRSGDFIIALLRESQDLNELHSLWARWNTMPPIPRATASAPTAQWRFCIPNCGVNLGVT
jgi:zinc dependent phospholipase C